ncbi:hypothetical protein QL285_069506 [Trifolium repens]|nr:hypothetical protein QL285_069506 [Trifolium repens]
MVYLNDFKRRHCPHNEDNINPHLSVCDSLGNRHNFYILKPDPAYSAPNEILGIWNPLSSHSSLFVIKNQKNPLTLTAPITQIQINKPCSPNFSNDEASSSPFQSLTCSNPSKSLNPHRSIVLSPIRRPCNCHTTTAGTFPHCQSLVASRRRLSSSDYKLESID